MSEKKMEKAMVEKELSLLFEKTLLLEDELNSAIGFDEE
jgi:hypothetical protein